MILFRWQFFGTGELNRSDIEEEQNTHLNRMEVWVDVLVRKEKEGEKRMTHKHDWAEWERILWYTPGGRFVGEARKCLLCEAVETRNVAVDTRHAVVQPTIGVFAGIFNEEGRILLKKITSGRFVGEWDLVGGGIGAGKAAQAPDERVLFEELSRLIGEEIGIGLSANFLRHGKILIPAILKGGGDWAFPIEVGYVIQVPTKGEYQYFSPREVQELAIGPEGNRILSGEGKRMHRLIMRLFCHSPNIEYGREAGNMLAKIADKIWN